MTSAPRQMGQCMQATWQGLIAAQPSRGDAHMRGKPPAASTWGVVAGSRHAAEVRARGRGSPLASHVVCASWPPGECTGCAGGQAGSPPARTRGSRGVARCWSVGWIARFALFNSGSVPRSLVQSRFDALESDFSPVHLHRLQCRAEHCSRVPTAQGRSVWSKKRGNLRQEGEEVLHTPKFSSPINRDPSPHFKTHKRRALKKRSAATIIVRK
jgi:hypothetical protein